MNIKLGAYMHYPAFIEVDKDGSASGWFPDVDGCIFAGDTIEDAIADARSAIDAHFEALAENGAELPAPHPMQEHVAANAKEYVGGQWVLVDIKMDKFDGKAERINITLPHRLLHQIDNAVKSRPDYGSRSAFIAAATRKELRRAG
jgi:predicted RNase H-like HicB family nuclease